jgi:hypothetical protein
MSPIAAYFVMISTETDRGARAARYAVPAPRVSLAERITGALETLVRLGRPSTAQTA